MALPRGRRGLAAIAACAALALAAALIALAGPPLVRAAPPAAPSAAGCALSPGGDPVCAFTDESGGEASFEVSWWRWDGAAWEFAGAAIEDAAGGAGAEFRSAGPPAGRAPGVYGAWAAACDSGGDCSGPSAFAWVAVPPAAPSAAAGGCEAAPEPACTFTDHAGDEASFEVSWWRWDGEAWDYAGLDARPALPGAGGAFRSAAPAPGAPAHGVYGARAVACGGGVCSAPSAFVTAAFAPEPPEALGCGPGGSAGAPVCRFRDRSADESSFRVSWWSWDGAAWTLHGDGAHGAEPGAGTAIASAIPRAADGSAPARGVYGAMAFACGEGGRACSAASRFEWAAFPPETPSAGGCAIGAGGRPECGFTDNAEGEASFRVSWWSWDGAAWSFVAGVTAPAASGAGSAFASALPGADAPAPGLHYGAWAAACGAGGACSEPSPIRWVRAE